MAQADTALGKFSQQYGDRAFTVEPADGGYVFVRADHVDVDASGCLLIRFVVDTVAAIDP